jgi:hypothetical protein
MTSSAALLVNHTACWDCVTVAVAIRSIAAFIFAIVIWNHGFRVRIAFLLLLLQCHHYAASEVQDEDVGPEAALCILGPQCSVEQCRSDKSLQCGVVQCSTVYHIACEASITARVREVTEVSQRLHRGIKYLCVSRFLVLADIRSLLAESERWRLPGAICPVLLLLPLTLYRSLQRLLIHLPPPNPLRCRSL